MCVYWKPNEIECSINVEHRIDIFQRLEMCERELKWLESKCECCVCECIATEK